MEKQNSMAEVIGEEFFLYEDDKAFIIADMSRDPKLLEALKNDTTEIIYKRFKQVATNGLPIVATVCGSEGLGRDAIGLAVAYALQKIIDETNSEPKVGEMNAIPKPRIRFCFSDIELNELLKDAQMHDIILHSKRPTSYGWYVNESTIHNIRRILCIKGVNYIGISRNLLRTSDVIQFEALGYKTDKSGYRTLVHGGRNNTLLGLCYFQGFPQELDNEFTNLKMKNIADLLEAGGDVRLSEQEEAAKLQKDAQTAVTYIKTNKLPISKSFVPARQLKPLLETVVSLSKIQIPNPQYRKTLVSYILILLRMENLT